MKITDCIGILLLAIGMCCLTVGIYHFLGAWTILIVYGVILVWIGYLELLNE